MSVPFSEYVDCAVYTDTGLVRPNNEDRILEMPEEGFFAVSDGMGGESCGEMASQYVIEGLKDSLENSQDYLPGERKYIIQQSIHKSNLKIRGYIKKHGLRNMGCTLVSLLLDPWNPNCAKVCHLGDSRLYCFRKKQLHVITVDHTLAEMERIYGHKVFLVRHAGILTRAIGIADFVHPEWQELQLFPKDIFFLCSDGVSSYVGEKKLFQCFLNHTTPQEIIQQVKECVLEAGAKDNFSMICLKFADRLPLAITPSDEEREESDYLARISENRVDYAKQ